MSWLPIFKIGFWNAWILMLIVPLHPLIMKILDKAVGTGDMFKKMGDVPYEKGEKRDYTIFMVVLVILTVYSVFLPLKLGTAWFYAGFAMYLVGLAILLSAIVNVATTPMGQVFTKGIYYYSRNPMYIALLMIFVGVGIASASWIFLLFSILIMGLATSQAVAEERGCLATYGNKYKEYMKKTPRWVGIPKSK